MTTLMTKEAASGEVEEEEDHDNCPEERRWSSVVRSMQFSLSNSVLFFPLPFLAVTATAELKEGPSSDTLAACKSKN
jgi:hypothetical protein